MFERLGSLEQTVANYANFLVAERINELDVDIRLHPEEYAEYQESEEAVKQAEEALRQAVCDQELLTTLLEAINVRSALESELAYRLGFMDGGKLHHCFTMHELPAIIKLRKKEDGV